ncbi:pyruvate dehydrogenase complex dihydrolipoamide acetyltransferase [Ekhidna sp.]|uniref:pyruvate dehydrogenase complex dihydrolipoamide acetyltransferase n=1 Tax=Ekhidna sp. TaxID=2608089 RepID=UPI003C7C7F09
MAEVIRMPKMSDTMEEGVIASWLKKEGDEVSSGDVLAEVETDKATMELESYQDGVLLHIGVKEKEAVPVDGILAVIGEKGEDYQHLLEEAESGASDNGSKETDQEEKPEKKSTEKIDTSSINASIIRMPKMSDTMEEGVIASWLKKKGDNVESGDILAEVETDKATMELEAYEDGTLLYTAVEAGSGVPVDGVIAIIGEEGADYEALLKAEEQSSDDSAEEEKKEDKTETPSQTTSDSAPSAPASSQPTQSQTSSNGRIKASPLAKKIASEKGIDLSQVNGSGPDGRVVKADVENFTASQDSQPATSDSGQPSISIPQVVGEEKSEKVELSQMRKTIAKRLSDSKFTAPHFYLTMEINMDKAIEARKSMNEVSPVKISFNDMVVKAAAAALRQHPDINVSWKGDHMMRHQHIHLGVAVAIPEGLIVPVVRFADSKSLSHISAEVRELAQKAKDKKLKPEEFSGGTFSISNLGMFGIEEFTAIINPPEACIMAVGGIKETVIVKDGEMYAGNVMKVTLSCDHRAVDGAVGSAFLKTFKELLEDPVRILI